MNDKNLLDKLKSAPRTPASDHLDSRINDLFTDQKTSGAPWKQPLFASLLCVWSIACIAIGLAWGRSSTVTPEITPTTTQVQIIHHHTASPSSAFDIAQTGDLFFEPQQGSTIEYAVEVSAEPSTNYIEEEPQN